jgi:hypothetical protein
MVISVLLVSALGFGAVFVVSFTVENRTGQVISITPVGTVGKEGVKWPLPVKLFAFPLAALRQGGFRLADGESMTIRYDMDDINFSEIVIADEHGRQFQLITDPDPTADQYHGPVQRHYMISELAILEPVSPPVQAAASRAAQRDARLLTVELTLLIGPWVVYAGLKRALRAGQG